MTIDSTLIGRLISVIASSVDPVERGSLLVFSLGDVTLTLNRGSNTFNGLVFDALSETFVVNSERVLFIQLAGEESYFKVEDRRLISIAELFLEWRITAIELLA